MIREWLHKKLVNYDSDCDHEYEGHEVVSHGLERPQERDVLNVIDRVKKECECGAVTFENEVQFELGPDARVEE